MKRLLVSMLSILVTVTMNAGKVSEQEALKKASHFMQGKQLKAANSSRAKQKGDTNAAFYVFNAENNGGFVIVSGDDRIPEILGYSMHGELDANDTGGISWLLDCYKQVLDSLALVPDTGNKARTRAPESTKPAISPLITTEWGQDKPYNSQCPDYKGNKCVTGDVATAMAQIMNYYQWPQQVTVPILGYTTPKGVVVSDLEQTSFNWVNMTDDDIANLMRYCGQAVHTNYNSDGSDITSPVDAFINIFGYSQSTQMLYGFDFTATELENIVYDELSNLRPVFYTGSNEKEDHAFVVDGYENGLFHINWGNNGKYDGYFVLTSSLEKEMPYPFGYKTEVTIGIRPKSQSAENAPVITSSCVSGNRSAYRNNSNESFAFQQDIMSNLYCDVDGVTFQTGYALYNKNGDFVKILGSNTSTFPLYASFGISMTWGADIPIGDYIIKPVYRKNDSEEWKQAVGSNLNYLIAHVNEKSLVFESPIKNSFLYGGVYCDYGAHDIDGITYKLCSEYNNNWARILPYQLTGKYSGSIVIPNKVTLDDKTFIVDREEYNPFVECNNLESITSSAEFGFNIYNCPNLTNIVLHQGNSIQIGGCNNLESIEFPITANTPSIRDCEKLKTIRFKSEALDFIQAGTIDWSPTSLPALTAIYFPTPNPPVLSQSPGAVIDNNSNVTIHVPKGSTEKYKAEGSAWRNWAIADDEPGAPFISWGYCKNDAISSMGGGTGSEGYTEVAIKVPAEELAVYRGSKITHIQLYSMLRVINDYDDNDYEYVFITKPGTDYLAKQSFDVIRGAWNTIELSEPYTITGEDIYVGFGKRGTVGWMYSDDSSGVIWTRDMVADGSLSNASGEWHLHDPKYTHPIPLKFGIGGNDVPEGVAIRDLKVVTSSGKPVRTRADEETTIQGVVRNRSTEFIKSYTVAYSVDGGATQTQNFTTDLAPNEAETIEIALNGISSGEHTVNMDITQMNGSANVLSNQNSPSMVVNGGQQVEYVNVDISSIGKLAYSSKYALDFSDVEGLKAYTVTGYDNDNKTIWMTRVNNAPAETGLMLKGAEGTYEIPVKATSTSAFKNFMKAIVDGGTVNQTEGELTNYYLAESGDNGPGLYQVDGSVNLGANRSYLQLPTILSPSGSSGTEDITISSIGKLAYSSNNSLDFTNVAGLKAYTVTGYNKTTGTIWLSRVNKVPAQTGVYLKGDPGNYTVPTLSMSGCYSNMLKPCVVSSTIASSEGSLVNYYLAGSGTNGPGFYPVEGSVTLGNNRSYLQIPTTVGTATRSAVMNSPTYDNFGSEAQVETMSLFGIKGNDATGIAPIKNDTMSEGALYNLNGQRTNSPSKGIYIKNGKKVIVL